MGNCNSDIHLQKSSVIPQENIQENEINNLLQPKIDFQEFKKSEQNIYDSVNMTSTDPLIPSVTDISRNCDSMKVSKVSRTKAGLIGFDRVEMGDWTFQGNLENGKMSGMGILSHPNFEFEGPFIDNLPHGLFVIRYKEGVTCMANYDRGKRQGQNVFFSEHCGSLETVFQNGELLPTLVLNAKGKKILFSFNGKFLIPLN